MTSQPAAKWPRDSYTHVLTAIVHANTGQGCFISLRYETVDFGSAISAVHQSVHTIDREKTETLTEQLCLIAV